MPARLLLGLSFVGFIALGLPEGALGVAWPSIAGDNSRLLGELGVLLAAYTVGYLASTVTNGRVMRRFGLGRMLPASSGAAALALGLYALGGAWTTLVAASALLGLGAGLTDAGLNAYAALRHGSRVMSLLHASFGVGATVGPLIMTIAIELSSWQAGYGLLAALQGILAIAFWRTRDRWQIPIEIAARRSRGTPNLLLPMSLVVFFVYTGFEVAAGQWAFTLFTESRGMDAVAAGLLVAGYWGSFTAGRFVTAAIGDRLRPEALVGAGMLAALGGAVLLWWEPMRWLGPVGLLVIGLSLAPIFPMLTFLTPGRLGSEFAPTAIGYQLAAATVGAAVVPGSVGVAVERFGVGSIGPALVVWAALLLVAGLMLGAQAGEGPMVGYRGAS